MFLKPRLATLIALITIATACTAQKSDLVTDIGKNGGNTGGTGPTSLTYYDNIAPILANRCQRCHDSAGIASAYPLDSYNRVLPMRGAIKSATTSRRMPPWAPNEDGSCQTFKDSRYLTSEEIRILAEWADAGGPAGTPKSLPPVIPPTTLSNPTVSVELPVTYTPSRTTADDYQCFNMPVTVLDNMFTFTSDLFVTGFEVVPGNRRVVHHVIAWITSPRADIDTVITAKENENADAGWDCLGNHGLPGVNATPVVLWAPGTDAINYPATTGIAYKRDNTRVIVQMHYSTAGLRPQDDANDRTSIKFKFANSTSGLRPASWVLSGITNLNLAPGQSEITVTDQKTLAEFVGIPGVNVGGTVYGVYPHMHTRGTKISFARTSSSNMCLVDVPKWSFNWQNAYFYETPLSVNTGDQYRLTCKYSTINDTSPVVYGENTDNEMCFVFLYATVP